MLDELFCISSQDDLNSYGVKLWDDDCCNVLCTELAKGGVLFREEDYWTTDVFEMFDDSNNACEVMIQKANEGGGRNQKILHLLQVVSRFCPAVSDKVSNLLRKATC